MKSINTACFVFAAIAALCLTACKKDEPVTGTQDQPASVSFVISGDGYSNKTITISPGTGNPENETLYSAKWNFSRGFVTDGKMNFTFYADGKKTGKQFLGTDFANTGGPYTAVSILLNLNIADNDDKKYLYQEKNFGGNPLPPGSNITITQYGEVNKSIEGDFQGSLFNTLNDKIVTITNGHFIIPRGKDVK